MANADESSTDNSTDEEPEIYVTDDNEKTLDDAVSTFVNASVCAKIPRASRTKPYSNIIHNWFEFSGGKSKCKFCSTVLSGKNSTNLKNHLEKKHQEEYKKYSIEKAKGGPPNPRVPKPLRSAVSSVSIVESFQKLAERKDGLKKGSPAYIKFMRAIQIAFVSNCLPYRLIEDLAFKNMIATVSEGRLSKLDDRYELASGISNLSMELKTAVESSLQNAEFVYLTADLWSRPGFSSSMMGITCHYLDRHLRRIMRALLACWSVNHPHTGQRIFEMYNDAKDEWDLDEARILRIVTDNGSNIVNAFKECFYTLVENPRTTGVNLDDE